MAFTIIKHRKKGKPRRPRKIIDGVEHAQCKCGNWTIPDKYRYIICDDCREKRKLSRRKNKGEKVKFEWTKLKHGRKKVIVDKNFKITQEEIDKAIQKYLNSGGKITKLQVGDTITEFPSGYLEVHEFLMEP